jgi:hypothetical protein
MNYRNVSIVALVAVGLLLRAGAVVAQRSNIDPSLHPGLAEARQQFWKLPGRSMKRMNEIRAIRAVTPK